MSNKRDEASSSQRSEVRGQKSEEPIFYFGTRLHWFGILPSNWKFEPTTTGWSEVTLTVNATSVNAGGVTVGMSHSKSLVCAAARGTGAASPG